jgi:hypothetical protein
MIAPMKVFRPFLCLAIALCAASACSSPTKPAGSTTVTAATAVAPANGAQIANAAQPLTLVVANAVVTGGNTAVTYTFEVGTDAAFAVKIATKDVPETPGQTSVKLDPLPAGRDYFWHVRTTSAGTVGAFTSPLTFTIGPAVSVFAPSAVSPANGTTVQSFRPTFVVTNASRTGPVTSISYRFEVSTSATFSAIAASGTVAEGTNGQTSFTPSSDLSTSVTYFWHAQAVDDGSGVASAFSGAQSVTTSTPTRQSQLAAAQGLALWPGAQPPGTTGKARMGDNWDLQTAVAGPGGPLSGTVFKSPRLPLLRMFDLIDRGMDPQAGIEWMSANGYPREGFWVPAIFVIGFDFEYLSLNPLNNSWDLIIRSGG